MSELFQLLPNKSKTQKSVLNKDAILSNYTKKQSQFINNSYGYYTNIFIHKIVQDTNHRNIKNNDQHFDVINPQRLLKDIIKRFFLTDLQLIFVSHIAKLLQWNYNHKLLKQNHNIFKTTQKMNSMNPLNQKSEQLYIFLNLVCFYIKNYLGQQEEYKIINDYLNVQTNNQWSKLYNSWLKESSNDIFIISPKNINRLYRQYSRNCQNHNPIKNYNNMVDKILELSTTYSMIPGQGKIDKKKKTEEVQQEPIKGRKKIKTNHVQSKIDSSNISNLSKIKDHSGLSNKIFDPQQSNNNFVSNIMIKQSQIQGDKDKPTKKTLLRPRIKTQQVNNHITQFYNRNPSASNLQSFSNQNFKPQSSLMFNAYPSILNNRSSIYQAIPYTLRNNSNISNFWL